jgi:hypothetical protein
MQRTTHVNRALTVRRSAAKVAIGRDFFAIASYLFFLANPQSVHFRRYLFRVPGTGK